MIERSPDKARTGRLGGSSGQSENLPYRIELRDSDDGDIVERVLARALNAPLARAIFRAAQNEHPGRRITLRRGSRIVADSAH
jgi:hypothetical protein